MYYMSHTILMSQMSCAYLTSASHINRFWYILVLLQGFKVRMLCNMSIHHYG